MILVRVDGENPVAPLCRRANRRQTGQPPNDLYSSFLNAKSVGHYTRDLARCAKIRTFLGYSSRGKVTRDSSILYI